MEMLEAQALVDDAQLAWALGISPFWAEPDSKIVCNLSITGIVILMRLLP